MSWIATMFLALSPALNGEDGRSWTVYADKVFIGTGQVIEGGVIRVQDGKLAAVAPGSKGGDDTLSGVCVTPGLIDLSGRIDLGWRSVEQSSETPANLRVLDALDPFDESWTRQARSGVTCVLASPPDDAVIGGLGAVVKTGDGEWSARVVKRDAAVRAAIGSQPSMRNHMPFGRPTDFYTRRPTTRMGVEWTLRESFYEAVYSKKDPSREFPGSAVLLSVLDGTRPIAIQAWTTQDIRTAVFWKEEMEREGFGRPRMIVDAAAEAWKEPQLLQRCGAAVVLPPFPLQGRTSDGAFMAWDTPKILAEAGVPFALSSHNASAPDLRLDRQAGFAMRGGLSFERALAAVTLEPARMIGVESRVGSLEVGKDADLVIWSGAPFELTSRVIGVLIDGRLILDPRARNRSDDSSATK